MATERARSNTPARPRVHLPFDKGERKKLCILLALVVVGGGIIGSQLWKKKGPATAMAAGVAGTVQPIDLKDFLEQIRSQSASGSGKGPISLVSTVDEALEVFLGEGKVGSVPLDKLNTGRVFGLPDEYLAPPAREEKVVIQTPSQVTPEVKPTEKQVDPNILALQQVRLETVLFSSRNQAAVIDGRVLHCGELVGDFVITDIVPGGVVLQRDGKAYKLTLK